MFEDLLDIAKRELAHVEEKAAGLPEAQVTILFTSNENYYVAVNDIDGCICDELRDKKDTRIVNLLTMWKSGEVDLASRKFRKALIALDASNCDTNMILQGTDRLLCKKLSATMHTVQKCSLEIPAPCHEQAYTQMMERWESMDNKISPQLLSRYSNKLNRNVPYEKWLEWCEDDRTTGTALSTGVPCTLYFLVTESREIIGSIVINHSNTHRGHLHAGIAPWNRGKGYGSLMLSLALEKCREMGMQSVEIVPFKGNEGAIKTILKNGGNLVEEFFEDGVWSLRYKIEL